MAIDVDKYHENHHKFMLLLKLQNWPTRQVRVVEVMAITHFIAKAHKCIIFEFPNTRKRPLEFFLRWQRTNALKLVAGDEGFQKTIENMKTHELKRVAEEATH